MKILIYGINYAPELTGIGKYSGEMGEWLVKEGHDVTVFTAMPYYPEWEIHSKFKGKWWHKEIIGGAKVYRSPLYVPKGISSLKRIIHELSFLFNSSFYWTRSLFQKKYDLIICVSPPFHIGILPFFYSKLKKTILVTHIQDLQVDAAKDLNMLTNPTALNLMFKAEKKLLKNSTFVSTLTKGMSDRVEGKGISKDKIIMLPNWVDLEMMRPLPKDKSLRSKFGIPSDDIVILYSGNMGEKQGLDILIDVAESFKDRTNIHFILVGSGVGKQRLQEMAIGKQLDNIKFYPLQPYEDLPALLATADIHLVLQKKSASDLVMPSKLTGILAVGGSAIITALPGTSLHEVTAQYNMGIICEPESSGALKKAIETAIGSDLSEIRKNAYNYAQTHLNKNVILSNFLNDINKKP